MKYEDEYDISKLAYSITIALELYPGSNVSKEELEKLKCNSRWESVRKAWAEFTGSPYVIKPDYEMYRKINKNKTMNDKNTKNTNNYTRTKNNYTRF
jgi:hypothetical protein